MKYAKLAIISAVGLFTVFFLMSLLIPSHIRISRAINISAPKDSIQPHLSDIRQWQKWNTMVSRPDIPDQQYSPDKYRSGETTVLVEKIKPDTVFTQWVHQGGRKIAGTFSLYEQNGITVVQWYFDIHLNWYPWEKFSSITFDKQLGPSMESSLAYLKKLTEKTP